MQFIKWTLLSVLAFAGMAFAVGALRPGVTELAVDEIGLMVPVEIVEEGERPEMFHVEVRH